MHADIRKLGGLNLYFPFLDSKLGDVRSIRSQVDWLVLFSLFADRILFPPRSLFSGKYAVQNLSDLHNIPLLRALVESGVLVTTVTTNTIRDLPDLFERYSGLASQDGAKCCGDFLLFSRDEGFQRRVVSDYMFEKIRSAHYLTSAERIALAKTLTTRPDHSTLIATIQDLYPEVDSIPYRQLNHEAVLGYFLGGAKGNAAIMPPSSNDAPHEFFDHFYSKATVKYFGEQLIKRLAKPLHQISFDEFQQLRSNLASFRQKYHDVSIKHRLLFRQILYSLSKSHPQARLRAPIIGLQATAATAIGVALAPVFGAAALGLAVAAKWLWENVSKGYKINDRVADQLRAVLTRTGLLKPYHKELLELLENFEVSVNVAIKR